VRSFNSAVLSLRSSLPMNFIFLLFSLIVVANEAFQPQLTADFPHLLGLVSPSFSNFDF
jgi:hypothetical protein